MPQERSLPASILSGLWRLLGSLKLAVVLLTAVTAVCVLGTLLPQLSPEIARSPEASGEWLVTVQERYGDLANLYHALGLFGVYRSPGFALLVSTLLLNTLVCTLSRFRAAWRVVTARPRVVMHGSFYERTACCISLTMARQPGAADQVRKALGRHRYRVLAQEQDGAVYLYADRNRWGRLGGATAHLSLALIVLGFVWSHAQDGALAPS